MGPRGCSQEAQENEHKRSTYKRVTRHQQKENKKGPRVTSKEQRAKRENKKKQRKSLITTQKGPRVALRERVLRNTKNPWVATS
jgi:hypothetical protein